MPERTPDFELLLQALRAEGRTPVVVCGFNPVVIEALASTGVDYVVVADDTYDAWRAAR